MHPEDLRIIRIQEGILTEAQGRRVGLRETGRRAKDMAQDEGAA